MLKLNWVIATCLVCLPSFCWAAETDADRGNDGLRPFSEVLLEGPGFLRFPTQAEIQPLLEPVSKPFMLSSNVNQPARFQGLARIRDWTPSSLLRLSCFEQGEHLRVHFWGAKKGVTLRFYPLNTTVAAYQTFDVPGQGVSATQPAVPYGTLLATDDGRNLRLPTGTSHVSYQNGSVVVYRGDIRIVSVPLDGPVQAVFIEAPTEVDVRDLAHVTAQPAIAETISQHRLVLDGTRPADLTWKEELAEGSLFTRTLPGAVELSAEKTATVSRVSFPVKTKGIYEVIFQVEEATPGTGVVLLNDAGEPLEGIEFFRNRQGRLIFSNGVPAEIPNPDQWPEENRPVPYFGPGQWVRLIVTGGTSRYWVSGDGLHWGRVFDPRGKAGDWRSIGLFVRETNDPQKPDGAVRKIRLGKVIVRELDGLTGAVNAKVLSQAAASSVSMLPTETPPIWLDRVMKLMPAGYEAADWHYACVMQALANAINVEYSQVLLDAVLDVRLASLPGLPEQIKLLDDAALINRNRPDDALHQIDLWERLGRQVIYDGNSADLSRFMQAYMEASLVGALPRTGPVSRIFASDVMLLLHAENRTAELDSFINWFSFWISGEPLMRGWLTNERRIALYDIFHAQALSRAGGQSNASGNIAQPVSVAVSRSAENFYIDLLSALQERQYQDVVRLFRSNSLQDHSALVPSPGDAHLYVSLPLALRSIQQRQPDFAEAVKQDLSPAQQLHAEQVLSQTDSAAIERLAIQATGTPTAAAACQALGDRALANVDFVAAMNWYEEGLSAANPTQQPDLKARLRLASAALGKPVGEPPAQPVAFGTLSIPADRFEQRVGDLAAQSTGSLITSLPLTGSLTVSDFATAPLRAVPWGNFSEGVAEPNAMAEILRPRVWPLGNTSAVISDDLMIVTNRRRITAIELATGKPRWSSELGNSLLPGPLRPVIANGRIFLRGTPSALKYGVVCFDLKTGRALWRSDCGQNVVADPFLVHGRLFTLMVRASLEQSGLFSSLLSLVELNPETGELLESGSLCLLSERVNMPHECLTAWIGNRLVITISGAVICCDLQGTIQWQRSSRSLPLDVDPNFDQQEILPPIAANGRLFLQQPGNGAVECLAPETGAVVWRRGVIGLQRIVTVVGDRVIVKAAQGVLALDAATGKILWRRDLSAMLSAIAIASGDGKAGDKNALLCSRQVTLPDKMLIEFSWLDLATGDIKSQTSLTQTTREAIVLGPMVAAGNRLWCLSNRGIEGDLAPALNVKRIYELQTAIPAAVAVPGAAQ